MNIKKIKQAIVIDEPSYDWVFFENSETGCEEFCLFEDIDYYLSNFENKPCFVWDCYIEKWMGINTDDVLESELRDWFEGAEDQVVDHNELVAFIDKWNAKQKIRQYYPNYERIIVLDLVKFNNLIGNEDF